MYNLYKGVAHPWLCDAMGHLNVRHYLAMFDDANFQLLSEAFGWDPLSDEWADKGWADVSHDIRYMQEVRADSLVEISGGIRMMGRSSLTMYFEMTDKRQCVTFANLTAKTVFFDLAERKSIPISQAMHAKMACRLLEPV